MITQFSFDSLKRWISSFVELQLFLTTMSMPILIAWGLPISLGTILGNLIFAPFLAAFLLISSLLFFTELFALPNGFLAVLLEYSGTLWLWLLKISHQSWLIGYPQAPTWFLYAIAISALSIVALFKNRDATFKISLLTALLVCSYFLSHTFFCTKEKLFYIQCNTQKIPALFSDKQLIVIEPGALSKIKSPQSWVEYTFVNELIKATGTTTIDHLIVCQPGQRIFEAIDHLLTKIQVKNMYLIHWQGTLSKRAWAAYFAMLAKAKEQQCTITRIHNKARTIWLPSGSIEIAPQDEKITKLDLNFPVLHIVHRTQNHATQVHPQQDAKP